MQNCPQCGKLNDDDWPLEINGKIEEGGCQECWESQVDKEWWAMLEYVNRRKTNGRQKNRHKRMGRIEREHSARL